MAVKAWRMEIAGRIILDGDWMKRAPVSGDLNAPNFNNFLGEALGGKSSLRLTWGPALEPLQQELLHM